MWVLFLGMPGWMVQSIDGIGFLLPRISYLAEAFMGAADTAYWVGCSLEWIGAFGVEIK